LADFTDNVIIGEKDYIRRTKACPLKSIELGSAKKMKSARLPFFGCGIKKNIKCKMQNVHALSMFYTYLADGHLPVQCLLNHRGQHQGLGRAWRRQFRRLNW
jgi:hypothetical protein